MHRNQHHHLLLKRLLIISLFLFIYNFITIVSYIQFSQVDLRNRVVGTRLMQETSKDPYFYKWIPSDSTYFLIPSDQPHHIVNPCTVTPGVLLLQSSFAFWHYEYIRYFWWFFQISCLFLIFFYFYRKAKGIKKSILLIFLFVVVFGLDAWHVHIVAGQIYIFYGLIFTGIYHFYKQKDQKHQIIAGILLGILIWFRPTFIFFALILFIYQQWNIIKGLVISGTLLLLITIALGHIQYWQSYLKAMDEYGKEQLNTMTHYESTVTNKLIEEYASNLENTNFNRWDFLEWLEKDILSVQFFAKKLLNISLHKTQLLVMYFISLVLLLWFAKVNKNNFEDVFILAFLALMLMEYFVPAVRNPYNFAQWFPILFLYIKNFKKEYLYTVSFLLFCLGFLFMLGFSSWFPESMAFGEIILFVSFVLFLKERKKIIKPTVA